MYGCISSPRNYKKEIPKLYFFDYQYPLEVTVSVAWWGRGDFFFNFYFILEYS